MEEPNKLLKSLPKRDDETIFGGILVTGVLGQGGTGVVLKGVHLRLNIPVAVKFFTSTASRDKTWGLKEAHLAARINHVNVVRIYDVNQEGGLMYLVQELVEGRTLTQISGEALEKKAPLSEVFMLDVAEDTVRGLEAIHRQGVIHGDIKPDNLIVADEDGCCKILDLGLAKRVLLPSAAAQALEPKGAYGTLGFMSPEQLQLLEVSFASDFFSLGVTLYELATQRPVYLFNELPELMKLMEDEVPEVRALRPALGAQTAEIIRRCTRLDPQERYRTAQELLEAIAAARKSLQDTPEAAVRKVNSSAPLVLSADDDPGVSTFIRTVLENSGYRVISCPDGLAALQEIREQRPAAVILDIDMPKMNGLDLCRVLRHGPDFKDLPVIFLTGHSDIDAVSRAIQEGATDYLIKPFVPGEILDRLRCLLRIEAVKRELGLLNVQYEVYRQRIMGLLSKNIP